MHRFKSRSGPKKEVPRQVASASSESSNVDAAQIPDPMSVDEIETPADEDMSALDNPMNDEGAHKRPRACEACRGLKVRCDFPADADRCKRCARAKRRCVVTLPNPRRPRRIDTKVADLERQVHELTTALAGQQGPFSSSGGTPADWMHEGRSEVFSASETPTSWTSAFVAPSQLPYSTIGGSSFHFTQDSISSLPALAPSAPVDLGETGFGDVIDRAILSRDEAVYLCDYYRSQIMPWFPLVALSHQSQIALLRKTMPVLFLAVVTVASGHCLASKHNVLMREMLKTLAWHVLCENEKSLELIQAMHILSIWYVSDDTQDTKAFQLTQLACSMAIAMGLDRPRTRESMGSPMPGCPDRIGDEQRLNEARAWLGCFILNGVLSMKLRQRNTIRWSPYLEECVTKLQTSGPTENLLCKLARTQQITDRIVELSLECPNSGDKAAIEQELQRFLTELETLRENNSQEPDLSLLLNIHEAAVHARSVFMGLHKPLRPPSQPEATDDSSHPRTTSQSEALQAYISSIHQLLDHFALILKKQSPKALSAIPTYHFNRAINGLVSLISLHYSSLAPGSPIASYLSDPERDLRIRLHLTEFLESMRALGTQSLGRAIQRFHMLLKMLSTWFERASRSHRRQPERATQRHEETPEQEREREHEQKQEQGQGQGRPGPAPLQLRAPSNDARSSPRMGYRKLALLNDDVELPDMGMGLGIPGTGDGIQARGSRGELHSTPNNPMLPPPGPLLPASTWPQTASAYGTDNTDWMGVEMMDTPIEFESTLDLAGMDLSLVPSGNGSPPAMETDGGGGGVSQGPASFRMES